MEYFKQQYTIVASEMDITYHITPNAIMLYFQDCFARYLTKHNLAAFDIIKQNKIWVITEFDLNYKQERPLWAEDITAELCFKEIGSIRIYVDFRMRNHLGEVFAEGTSCWVIIDSVTKRPFAAKEMLNAGGIFGTEEGYMKIAPQQSSQKVFNKEVEHQVNVTDLDFNGHVCNRSYLSIAMATAPIDFIKTTTPKRFNIKFVRESFMGEVLTCKVYKAADNANIYWHSIVNSAGKDICSIYSEWTTENTGLEKDVSELIPRA